LSQFLHRTWTVYHDTKFKDVYQLRKTGSGQFHLPGQFYRSPGFAKIAPWCLAAGTDYRLKYRMTHRRTAPTTLSAHTRNRWKQFLNKLH
jgi:hypothetical protein